MRFALIGNDPDGIAIARALVASGRHELKLFIGAPLSTDELKQLPPHLQQARDAEEALADPAIDAVIVASALEVRGLHLHRALQSERHVLCACPPAPEAEVAYRASMLQQETHYVLLPLLPECLHPALARARALFDGKQPAPLGRLRLIALERWSTGDVLLNGRAVDLKLCFPGWDVLRALGGELAEVSVLTVGMEIERRHPVVAQGRFEDGPLLEARFLPGQSVARYCIKLIGERGEAELLFPFDEFGPAFLSWTDADGDLREEHWDHFDPWPSIVGDFESLVDGNGRTASVPVLAATSWEDAIRNLELDEAARRSAQRRRTVVMEYPEAGEDVNFKSTMTLIGCGILWIIILLAILAQWVPWFKWVVAGMLFAFLVSQMLRFVIPAAEEEAPSDSARTG